MNRGKGEALKTGLFFVEENLPECAVLGTMDCDGQHLPKDMLRVLDAAREHPGELILGSRNTEEMPLRSKIGGRLAGRAFARRWGVSLRDTQTGMRAFSRSLIPLLYAIPGSRYEYEMNVLTELAQENIPIREVSIHTIYRDRKNSTSHFRPVRDSLRIVRELSRFGASSLTGFAVDYCLFALLTARFPTGAGYLLLANVLARLVSGVVNYRLNRALVFSGQGSSAAALQYFLLAAGILAANSLVLTAYTGLFGLAPAVAKLLTELTLFAVSFFVQRSLIFRPRRKETA